MGGKSFYAIGVALFLACACAQAYQGSAEEILHPTLTPDTGSTMTTDYPPGATLELPELSEDEERKIVGLIKDELKNYTGISRAIQVDDENWAQVGEKNGFAIWQLHIHSPGSLGLQVWFSFFDLVGDMRVKTYGLDSDSVSSVGEYKGRGNNDTGRFWSMHVPDSTIVVEVWVPPGSSINSPADFPFFITHINHHFRNDKGETQTLRNFSSATSQSHGNCPTDNNRCKFTDGVPRWAGAARMIYTAPPSAGGKRQNCSANLLSNGGSLDRAGYVFLTAYHCIEDGTHPEMRVGTSLNATFHTGDSVCAPGLSATWEGAKFIAGNEQGDYALLWVEDEPKVSGGDIPIYYFGSTGEIFGTGITLGALHHGDPGGAGLIQDWAQVSITGHQLRVGIDSMENSIFDSCSGGDCSHYRTHSELGGLTRGSSGAALMTFFAGEDTLVNAVVTQGSQCSVWGSMFNKIVEDGRVACTLDNGTDYLTAPATCSDDDRPCYGSGCGSSTGGAVDPLTLLLLAAGGFLGSRLYRRKSKQRISEL
jgi:hypothetical protein